MIDVSIEIYLMEKRDGYFKYIICTVFNSGLTKSNIDASALFTKKPRDLVTSNNAAITVSGNLEANTAEDDATLDASVSNKTVFGIPSTKYTDKKTASAYRGFGNVIQDWKKDGASTLP
jgi:hypothetical protein